MWKLPYLVLLEEVGHLLPEWLHVVQREFLLAALRECYEDPVYVLYPKLCEDCNKEGSTNEKSIEISMLGYNLEVPVPVSFLKVLYCTLKHYPSGHLKSLLVLFLIVIFKEHTKKKSTQI